MTAPLEGIKVVEMTSVVLGPYACQMLGDLGADVVKIEPPGGDTNRNLGPHRNHEDMCSLYLTCNRNKRSVGLDMKSPEGLAAAKKILEDADVLVHNFRPQAIEKLGLGYEEVVKISPDIIYCGAYGFSLKGPYGEKGALDDSIQAASGIAVLQSQVEGEPRYLPTIIGDKTTAMMVVQSVCAALFHRERTGEGQQIEVPMFETMAAFVMTEHQWGQTFDPPIGTAGYPRLMSEHRRPYKTRDGYLAVLPYWDNHWETFVNIGGRPELASDERFKDMRTRLANIGESYKVTGEIIATKTTAEWLELLGNSRVPMMVVNSPDDLMTDPHLVESGFWEEYEHPTEGKVKMSRPPVSFSKSPASIRRLAPRLGEQTAEVLQEAGYSEEDIEAMLASGVARDITTEK
jgi:crotonobetainyl-CoA:carnitine CoA-transferase CaiB-like acyl-CoA transferase